MKRTTCGHATGLAGLLCLAAAAATAAQDTAPLAPICRGPYLQAATPNSIVVVWRTEWTNITPAVRFGKAAGNLDRSAMGREVVVKASFFTNKFSDIDRLAPLRTKANLKLPRLHSAPAGTFQYEAKLAALEPDTAYHYGLFDGDRRLTPASEAYSFRTPPLPGTAKPMRIWANGDSGSNRKSQMMARDAVLKMERVEQKPIDFILHMGDMAYTAGKDLEFQARCFKPYEDILNHLVLWPTFANHEGYSSKSVEGIGPFYDAFVVPMQGEAGGLASHREGYYSFQYGRVHFISIDSHELRHRLRPEMSAWIKADIKAARARKDADWVIAFYHHAPYTKGNHDSDKEGDLIDMRRNYVPIFEEAGVDVVLNGHSHIYERSMLMDGAYATNTVADNFILDDGDGNPQGDGPYRKSAGINPHEGTVYVVLGNGGARLTRRGLMPVMATTLVEFGSVIIDIDRDTLTATMVNKFGDKRDQFQIVKSGKVEITQKLPAPWQLPDWKGMTWNTDEEWDMMPPVQARTIIPAGAEWQYRTRDLPQGRQWTWPDFAPTGWKNGAMPMGFNYPQVRTKVESLRGRAPVFYLRKEFTIDNIDRIYNLGLVINYDDGFVAYLNGREVARRNIERGRSTYGTNIKAHGAYQPEWVGLNDWGKWLKKGRNVLAIEAHNNKADDPDFLIDASLVSEQ